MKKLKLISMLVLLSGTFACTNNPSNEADYLEKYSFTSEANTLTATLRKELSALSTRTEKGLLSVVITGPKVSAKQEQKILDDIKNNLMIDVILQSIEQQQDFYQVALEVQLNANTCRFEQSKVTLSASACLLKRNQYLQLVNSTTWQQGLPYINNDSALATGAVQRLYKNKIKMADKQTVTGD